MEVDQLILSGGGVLGYSYIGILKYFEENGIIRNVKNIVGCSAGAIFGSLIAFGYTSDELYTALISINPQDYFNITLDDILKFPITKGLDDCGLVMDKIKELIGVKTLNPNITFMEMWEKTGIKLEIGATNINTMKFELCNYITMPDIPIYMAIHASIAIPLLIKPVKIGDYYYCDGGVSNNYPINKIEKRKCLGIYLTNTPIDHSNPENMTIAEYIEKITKCATQIVNTLDSNRHNTIRIEIPRNLLTSMKFIMNRSEINKCIKYGYDEIKNNMANYIA